MQVYRQNRGGRLGTLPKILIALALIVGISFCLAWVWHTTEQSGVMGQASAQAASEAAGQVEEPPVADTAAVQEPPPVSEQAEEQPPPAEQSGEPAPANRVTAPGAVPESDPVDDSYFDDAIFFGDSISTGIPLYHIADNAAVVAMTGINTDNINYKKCIDIGGEERVTILEAAAALHSGRAKVYIMLGGNGIGFDKETFIAGYKTFLDSVRELYPDAMIYLQSMTPVVEGYVNEFDPTLDNAKIDEYNLEILALAQREKVYYLDVASALKNENGALPTEASPVDGMHFNPEYYHKWFDYLKKHTVSTEGKQ